MSGPFRLDGKLAAVTGGASGIGAATVALLRAQGANVAVLDLSECEGGISCDVSSEESVASAFAQIDTLGPLDILICCAGVGGVADILETTLEQFERFHAVNVRGVFLPSREAVRRMKESGRGGSIVHIASLVSKLSLERRFGYGTSKSAVLGITRSIAQDFIADKIRCNAICPARVHTPLVDAYLKNSFPGREAEEFAKLEAAQPMGRMGQTSEIAHLALYLCSDEAAFVTGVAYDIDGGCTAMR
jgi:NAD(P)-dependent dehydrogenase (short-subunit alcohol dehydrogenase family)